MAAGAVSTPINTISRENLSVLIRNNIMNDSVEFVSDCESSMMDKDSPVRKTDLQPISKKLFHSPMPEHSPKEYDQARTNERKRRARKRKQCLVPSSTEKIKRAYVKECEVDGYSPDLCGGMRKKVLISLFHNKEYSMDFS